MEISMLKPKSSEAGFVHAKSDFRVPARAGYALIFVAFGVCGLWSTWAPLDSAAVAQGVIEVDSRRKAIQHLEGGIVKEIRVAESQVVKHGDVMFRLEPTQARANSDMLRKQFLAALAREARLTAELDGKSEITFPEEVMEHRATTETATAIRDEQREFVERRQSLDNQVRALEARLGQCVQEITGRARQKAALTDQVASITTQLDSIRPIVEKGFYARNRLLELEREKARLVGSLGQITAEIARFEKQQDETRVQIEQLRQKFREDAAHDLTDTRIKLSDIKEKLVIASDVLTRVDIRAPVSGVVQNLRVNGVGAVVKAGETIADLVPAGDKLVVATQVSPLDIDSVASGQRAEIRFTSLSRRQAPTVFGQVQSVSPDSLVNETTKQSYYLARVVINRGDMPTQVAEKLTPGMPADVLIVTGERSALEYFVGPLRNALAKGMREK
jgi:HlyD family type I secretion membrane fusion protein